MPYDWIIFDADHTLFDFDASAEVALEESFRLRGLDYQQDYYSLYQGFNQQLWHAFEQKQMSAVELKRERFARLLAALGIDDDPLDFNDTYLSRLAHGTLLLDGAQDVIEALAKHHKLFILTNGLAKVQRPRLARSSLAAFIKDIIVSEEVGLAKPDAKIFELVLTAMAQHDKQQPAKEHLLMVGDSLSSDMQGALNAGIDRCWFNPQGQSQQRVALTYEISRLEALLELPLR